MRPIETLLAECNRRSIHVRVYPHAEREELWVEGQALVSVPWHGPTIDKHIAALLKLTPDEERAWYAHMEERFAKQGHGK